MAWKIELSKSAAKRLAKIDKVNAKRIIGYLRERIAPLDDPRTTGKALTGPLGEFWRYRVGDFRILCEIQDNAIVILVVEIGNRRDIYK